MTHDNIFTKFLIEYDKANITSSYPSLTKYEVCTILDKAYLALISQKVTGNNPRKTLFESDIKAIHDLQGLIEDTDLRTEDAVTSTNNELVFSGNNISMMYYITSCLKQNEVIMENVDLINHVYADKFRLTKTNKPWLDSPVAYLHNNDIHVLVDPVSTYGNTTELHVTYIKYPTKFVDTADSTPFELSDTMAEELINLAILFATENVESPRLQTKSSILSLES